LQNVRKLIQPCAKA